MMFLIRMLSETQIPNGVRTLSETSYSVLLYIVNIHPLKSSVSALSVQKVWKKGDFCVALQR